MYLYCHYNVFLQLNLGIDLYIHIVIQFTNKVQWFTWSPSVSVSAGVYVRV